MASTNATATTLLFTTAAGNHPPIIGQPTDDDLFALQKKLYPLLHNLKYDEVVVPGVNNHNLIGLAQNAATYTAARGAPFPRPANPGPYDMTIPEDATPVVRNRMEAAHTVRIHDFNTYEAAEEGIKTVIYATVEDTWIKALCDAVTFYNNVTGYDMFEHLRTNSGGLHDVDLASLPAEMLHYYEKAASIPEFILELENSREKLARGGVPMPDATLLSTAHAQVMASLQFPEDTRAWELLAPALKTWAAWQVRYRAADIARNRLLKMNPLAFGAANHVADTITDNAAITMALDNIANAATNDSNLIARLNDRIKALEILVRQAPPIIQAPIIQAPPIITTTTTGATPYVARIYTQADALATFDVNGYCYTHGCRVHASHTSKSCKKKRRGHKDGATKTNMMGGSTKNQGWETNPNPM